MDINPPLHLAYFVTPHGYGHAARAAAVMTALQALVPTSRFEIFTLVPQIFFGNTLGRPVGYHSLLTDIGLVQQNSLQEDLPETLRRLDDFLPFDPQQVEELARQIQQLGCQLLVCDIAPLGLAVAQAAGIPSILIENFTWDWIYEGYAAGLTSGGKVRSRSETEPSFPPEVGLAKHIPYLQDMFGTADYHIQTEPVCSPQAVDLTTGPVSRRPRTPALKIRARLEVPNQVKLVLITMGGSYWDYTFITQLQKVAGCMFIIAGNGQTVERQQNVIILPQQSDFFHPDLVNACDAVIGKVGYSTLAEVYQAGLPFGYLPRQRFRESPLLTAYIEAEMDGLPLTEAQFQAGQWLELLPELLSFPKVDRPASNGADEIAQFILGILAES